MKIFIVRHGESEFNVHAGYLDKADCDIELTENGREQARESGKVLSEMLSCDNVRVLVSPFKRTMQTFKEMNIGLKTDNHLSYVPK